MEQRRLGRLERQVSVLAFGGASLADVPDDVADASVALALDSGITYLDTARGYGDSERHLGRHLPSIRPRVFLATKTGGRTEEDAWHDIQQSLELLHVDHVDLLQLHAVTSIEELDAVTAPSGALGALVRAREEGITRAIGITGHGTGVSAVHLEALRRFPFDTVLTPLNAVLWRDEAFRSGFVALRDEAARQDAALLTIKTVARRNWPTESHTHATWYEPYADGERIRAALSWVLAQPGVTSVPTAGDTTLLAHLVAAESHRMDPDEALEVLAADDAASSPFLAMPF